MKSKAIHLIADIVVQTVLANGAANVAGVLTARLYNRNLFCGADQLV